MVTPDTTAPTAEEAVAWGERHVKLLNALAQIPMEFAALANLRVLLALARDGQRWRDALAPAHPMTCDCDDYRRPSIMCGYCGRPTVQCRGCFAQGAWGGSESEAVAAWNRRVTPPATPSAEKSDE